MDHVDIYNLKNLKILKPKSENLGEWEMGTTTVVEINAPKICGSCGSKKLKYMTEDYAGMRDTYWMCKCGWEDFGATYSLRSNITANVNLTEPEVFKIIGLPTSSFVDDLLDLDKVVRLQGQRGKDKSPRSGRADKGKTRGPNKRTLEKVAAMNSKRGKSRS